MTSDLELLALKDETRLLVLKTRRDLTSKDEAMIRKLRLIVIFLTVTAVSACATIAGGLIGTGVGLATGHPVSGALIGTGVGIMVDTAPRRTPQDASTATVAP